MLISSDVKPILVFDGAKLPMKLDTEEERQRNRLLNKERALEYQKQGNSMMAHKMFSAAVDITPEMAYEFVQFAKTLGVEHYTAPYEADAQLAFLYLTGRAQVILTEDSDLLIFGVKKCFFKMDKNGLGIEVDLDNLGLVQELNFKSFTPDMLLTTCILSGCDYIESIKGIGFKKAHKLVYETGKDVKALLRRIRRDGKHLIPANYE
jgi:exonuclease 1